MLKFKKLFSGSYQAEFLGYTFQVQTYGQYSGEDSTDSEGNKWVCSIQEDWNSDHQGRFMTKKEAVEYANQLVLNLFIGVGSVVKIKGKNMGLHVKAITGGKLTLEYAFDGTLYYANIGQVVEIVKPCKVVL